MDNEDANVSHGTTMLPVCSEKFNTMSRDIKTVKFALYGEDGTDGLVSVIRELGFQNRIMAFIGMTVVGVLSSVVTALLIIWAGGRL